MKMTIKCRKNKATKVYDFHLYHYLDYIEKDKNQEMLFLLN
jgi:hypothetical protein